MKQHIFIVWHKFLGEEGEVTYTAAQHQGAMKML